MRCFSTEDRRRSTLIRSYCSVISQNDEGFMITGDGDFISSDGVRVSLRDLSAVKFSNMQLIEPASGLVLLQYKDERTEPKNSVRFE